MDRCHHVLVFAVFLLITFILFSCAPTHRDGFIKDPKTEIQYGSIIENNIFVDSSQFENKEIKTSIRNVSGDVNYDLHQFKTKLESSFVSKGYITTASDKFGIRLDLNVLYSGHIQKNMMVQYAFLGGAAGGIAGYRSDIKSGTAIGILSGVTLGAIIGSYITEDTYIMLAEVSIGISRSKSYQYEKKITFGSSPKLQPDQEEKDERGFSPFADVLRTRIAVFAGGRNLSQDKVVEGVKNRLIRIVSDII